MITSCETPECEKRFEKIEEKLHRGDMKFTELGIKLDSLINVQKTLTKALWGLATAIIAALCSFVLGKI